MTGTSLRGLRRLVRGGAFAGLAVPLLAAPALGGPATPVAGRSPTAVAGATAATRGGTPTAPGLSIEVGDGRTHAKPGDLLSYTVTLHNTGAADAGGLELVQTLPPGLRLISASRHGVAHADQVSWRFSLPAGQADSFGVAGQVGRTPPQLLRLATIACVTAKGSVRPIVCAAHSDELPAGARAAAAAGRLAAPSAGQAPHRYLPVLVVALLLAALTVVVPRRLALRARARRWPGQQAGPPGA